MKHTATRKELELLKSLRNWIAQKGYSPSIRDLCDIMKYKSPRSISVLLDGMMGKGIIKRENGELKIIENSLSNDGKKSTVDIPLVGSISCGSPILAEENIIEKISIDTSIAKPPHRYFFLEAKGDSMNKKGINDGDLLLVKQQQSANNGDIVIALINDEATVKEFQMTGSYIMLKPHSTNKKHKKMIIASNLILQGVVESIVPQA